MRLAGSFCAPESKATFHSGDATVSPDFFGKDELIGRIGVVASPDTP
jgi:hypothetical protein